MAKRSQLDTLLTALQADIDGHEREIKSLQNMMIRAKVLLTKRPAHVSKPRVVKKTEAVGA